MKRSVKFLGLIALIAIFGFALVSCDPGVPETPTAASFVGTWIMFDKTVGVDNLGVPFTSMPEADVRLVIASGKVNSFERDGAGTTQAGDWVPADPVNWVPDGNLTDAPYAVVKDGKKLDIGGTECDFVFLTNGILAINDTSMAGVYIKQ